MAATPPCDSDEPVPLGAVAPVVLVTPAHGWDPARLYDLAPSAEWLTATTSDQRLVDGLTMPEADALAAEINDGPELAEATVAWAVVRTATEAGLRDGGREIGVEDGRLGPLVYALFPTRDSALDAARQLARPEGGA